MRLEVKGVSRGADWRVKATGQRNEGALRSWIDGQIIDHKLFGDGPEQSDADGEQQPESLLSLFFSVTLDAASTFSNTPVVDISTCAACFIPQAFA